MNEDTLYEADNVPEIRQRFRRFVLSVDKLMQLREQHKKALQRASQAITLRVDDSSCPVLKYIGKQQVQAVNIKTDIDWLQPKVDVMWADLQHLSFVQEHLALGAHSPLVTEAFLVWLAER